MDTTEAMVVALEAAGYRIVPPSAVLDEQLRARMEGLASDLMVIDGLTKRGATLSSDYRHGTLQSVKRMVDRLFDALAGGEPSWQPWDR